MYILRRTYSVDFFLQLSIIRVCVFFCFFLNKKVVDLLGSTMVLEIQNRLLRWFEILKDTLVNPFELQSYLLSILKHTSFSLSSHSTTLSTNVLCKNKETLSGPLHPFPNLSMYLHHLSMYLIIPQEQPCN